MAKQKNKVRKIAKRIPPLPPVGIPKPFLQRFGPGINARKARLIAEAVQSRCIDGMELVEVVVPEVGGDLGLGRSRAYEYMRAGRWLLHRECGQ